MDEFRLLGPLEAVVDGTPVRLAAEKPRALLALLLLNRNRVVPTERLVDELWGEEPPARAFPAESCSRAAATSDSNCATSSSPSSTRSS